MRRFGRQAHPVIFYYESTMDNVDFVGRRFGRLVVVSFFGKDERHNRLWRCICDCGNEKVVTRGHLRPDSHGIRSCGCWSAENRADLGERKPPPKPHGTAARHMLYRQYRKAASDKGLLFDLSEEDFAVITSQNCYYCGCVPSREVIRPRANGTYICNGVDRVDNTKGYTLSNVRPCCSCCNFLKSALTEDEFLGVIRHAARIAANLGIDVGDEGLVVPERPKLTILSKPR